MSMGAGWGCPLYKSTAWNIPENMYVKHNTDVCEDVMYRRMISVLHFLLMADAGIITRWAEGLRKVILAFMK